MKLVMVRYTVKPESVEENVKLVTAVYEELSRSLPSGLRYATFQAPDGITFVHLAWVEPDQERHPLTSLASFQRFTAAIGDRCAELPVSVDLDAVGSYRFLDADPRA
jgi:hypothetical protein